LCNSSTAEPVIRVSAPFLRLPPPQISGIDFLPNPPFCDFHPATGPPRSSVNFPSYLSPRFLLRPFLFSEPPLLFHSRRSPPVSRAIFWVFPLSPPIRGFLRWAEVFLSFRDLMRLDVGPLWAPETLHRRLSVFPFYVSFFFWLRFFQGNPSASLRVFCYGRVFPL